MGTYAYELNLVRLQSATKHSAVYTLTKTACSQNQGMGAKCNCSLTDTRNCSRLLKQRKLLAQSKLQRRANCHRLVIVSNYYPMRLIPGAQTGLAIGWSHSDDCKSWKFLNFRHSTTALLSLSSFFQCCWKSGPKFKGNYAYYKYYASLPCSNLWLTPVKPALNPTYSWEIKLPVVRCKGDGTELLEIRLTAYHHLRSPHYFSNKQGHKPDRS